MQDAHWNREHETTQKHPLGALNKPSEGTIERAPCPPEASSPKTKAISLKRFVPASSISDPSPEAPAPPGQCSHNQTFLLYKCHLVCSGGIDEDACLRVVFLSCLRKFIVPKGSVCRHNGWACFSHASPELEHMALHKPYKAWSQMPSSG